MGSSSTAPQFTGFVETTYRADDGELVQEMATTISYWPTELVLARLGARMEAVQPGTHLRVDLISWDEETAAESRAGMDPADYQLDLTAEELDALWKLLVTERGGARTGRDGALKVRVIEKVQRLVETLPDEG